MNPPTPVSLSDVTHRLVSYSREIMERLAQSAKTKEEERKRKLLTTFLAKTSSRFMALLVASRWAKGKQDLIANVSQVMTHLSEMQWQLDQPPTRLYHIHSQLRDQTRAPLYDVPTAVDVLGTGSYPRLPKKLKVEREEGDKELDEEKDIELLKYTVMCCLFDCEDGLEGFTKIEIDEKEGYAKLENKGQFMVHVVPLVSSVNQNRESASYSGEIKWVVLSVALLVAAENRVCDYSPFQIEHVRRMAQNECLRNGLLGLFEFLSGVCDELAFHVLVQQSRQIKETMKLNVISEEKKMIVRYWNVSEGGIVLDILDNSLRIVSDALIYEGFDYSKINLGKIVMDCIMHKSEEKLKKYQTLDLKNSAIIRTDCTVSLHFKFCGNRWCKLFIDSKTGELKMILDPSFDVSSRFLFETLLLFKSENDASHGKAFSILQCKAILQSALALLPINTIQVLHQIPHSSISNNALCIMYRQSKMFFVVIELTQPSDCPSLTLYELGNALKKHDIIVTKSEGENEVSLQQMLSEVLSVTLFRKLKILMIVRQLNDLGFKTKTQKNVIHCVCERDLFGLFEREIRVYFVNEDEIMIEILSVFELTEAMLGKRPELQWESHKELLQKQKRREWRYGPIAIADDCLKGLMKDLKWFANAMETCQLVDPDLIGESFKISVHGLLIGINEQEMIRLSHKNRVLEMSAKGKNEDYYESRCLPTLHRLCEGWKGS